MIEPGLGTSEFKIGTKIDDMDFSSYEIIEKEDRDIFIVFKTKFIWFFFVKDTQKLDQLTLFSPFKEKVLGRVSIGDSLSDVYKHFGKCCINHKVHEPLKYAGIAFEAEKGSKSKNAIITKISVSEPYEFYPPNRIKEHEFKSGKRLP